MNAPESSHAAAQAAAVAGNVSSGPAPASSGAFVRFALSFLTGLIAGVIAWVAIERSTDFYEVPASVTSIFYKMVKSAEEQARIDAAFRRRDYQTSISSMAILGGSAGCLLGLGAGLRRSAGRALSASLVGLVLGVLTGAFGGVTDMFLTERLRPLQLDGILMTIAAQSAGFLVMATGAGVAAGWALRRIGAAVVAACAGAFIAGLAFAMLAAALFPVLETDVPVPRERWPLLLWTMLPAGLMGLALGRVKSEPRLR